MRRYSVFTTFSGYDSQMLALRRLEDYSGGELQFDLVGWSEIDRHAITAHDALFPEYAGRNFGDITKIDWPNVPEIDFLTYSSPCQDFSIAGMQKGGEKGSGTRSSLLWEIEHAITAKHPKWLLMENVDALTSAKFRPLLNKWLNRLSSYGYTNHVKVLNAKSYGVPQNRNRVFILSILGNGFQTYNWPIPFKLTRRLRDVLESDVDDSYFLTEKQIGYFTNKNNRVVNHYKFQPKTPESSIANCLVTPKGWGNPTDNYIIGGQNHTESAITRHTHTNGGVYANDGISPTIIAEFHGMVPVTTEPKIDTLGSYGPKRHCNSLVVNNDGISPTCLLNNNSVTATMDQTNRIRKLTPREFYRLMDVDDADIDKMLTALNGKSAHYKLAGNSIVVSVLFHVFRKLFLETENESQQLTLF